MEDFDQRVIDASPIQRDIYLQHITSVRDNPDFNIGFYYKVVNLVVDLANSLCRFE